MLQTLIREYLMPDGQTSSMSLITVFATLTRCIKQVYILYASVHACKVIGLYYYKFLFIYF